ncbi:DUF6035 family protein [Rhizobium ruizarguesonis]|uniref:DUF6035 family protein n=1 Tax=Rhizobium ruizarguesonis TaxID=2081791 RepID=UPI0013DED4FC|nr:DUF6035 family protein [Rhizobium ruizarguesonis]NEJ95965.1 hypothetical protein [Rhizobium ruizarguesonis]
MHGNVTIDPLASAVAVENPAIAEILDLKSGELLDAATFISARRYDRLVAERVSIRESFSSKPRFGCGLCATPVYLVASHQKRFFFRHSREDGSCPSITRSELSRDEIRALKYAGQRESLAHQRIKDRIVRSLQSDPANSEILIERQWRSARDGESRRQPDVQAVTSFGRIAFEAQLSTTFLDVVTGRRSFYRDEGALLVWVMAGFEPTYRRMTTDDLLFSNNSNILVVHEEAARLSEQSGVFQIRAHYRIPELVAGELRDRWASEIVAFRDLTVDRNTQTAWFFDYNGEATRLLEDQAQLALGRDDDLRKRIIAFWMSRHQQTPEPVSREADWQRLLAELSERGVTPPRSDRYDRAVTGLMNGILSAREMRPIGWDFKSLVQVAHKVADGYPQHVLAMGFAIRAFGCAELIAAQDKSHKWEKRSMLIRAKFLGGDQSYRPDEDTLPFLKFVFPDIGSKVERFLQEKMPHSNF